MNASDTVIVPSLTMDGTYATVPGSVLRDTLAKHDSETFEWRYRIERTIDAIVWLSLPPTSAECSVCGESHRVSDDWGNADSEQFHTLILSLDQSLHSQEELAQTLYEAVQDLRPEWEDTELSEMIECARVRFSVLEPENEPSYCEEYTDSDLGEAISDWLTYGIERELPEGVSIIWDGDSGTVSIWEV